MQREGRNILRYCHKLLSPGKQIWSLCRDGLLSNALRSTPVRKCEKQKSWSWGWKSKAVAREASADHSSKVGEVLQRCLILRQGANPLESQHLSITRCWNPRKGTKVGWGRSLHPIPGERLSVSCQQPTLQAAGRLSGPWRRREGAVPLSLPQVWKLTANRSFFCLINMSLYFPMVTLAAAYAITLAKVLSPPLPQEHLFRLYIS